MKNSSYFRWIIWMLALLYYSYEFIIRIAPSVMIEKIMTAFHIDAAMGGTIVAAYLYIYAPMQIPVGILLDRYGARKLMTFGALSCGVGTLIFGLSINVEMLFIGRIFMGLGSAFAFVCMVYISSHWFEKSLLPVLIGIGNSFGMLGAVWGEGPLSYFSDSYGLRHTVIALGFLGVLLALLIFIVFFFCPKDAKPVGKHTKDASTLILDLGIICSNPQTWLNAIVSALSYVTTTAFAGLWGVSFIQKAHGQSAEIAGFTVSMIFVAWVVGGPIMGFLNSRFFARKTLIGWCSLFAGATLSATIYIIGLPEKLTFVLFFFVGFFSSAQLLTFSYAILINPIEVKGSAVALTNFLVMIAGSVLQPFVGYLLDIHAGIGTKSPVTAPIYTVGDYQFALSIFPIFMVLAFFASFLLKRLENNKIA